MSRFFIERPIFAWVIAVVIMLAGAISIVQLPIAQYPQIAPPTVTIATTYPGASASTVENSVTQVIEQAMNGLDNLLYIQWSSASNGSAQVTITFTNAANPDIAQVQVQNKLQQAIALLPAEVQQQGVVVTKSNSSFLMVIGFVSKDGTMGATDLADYVASHVLDPMSRVSGVGNVHVADTADPAHRIEHMAGDVVGEIGRAHRAVLRHEANDHQEAGVRLGHHHALLLHLGGQ